MMLIYLEICKTAQSIVITLSLSAFSLTTKLNYFNQNLLTAVSFELMLLDRERQAELVGFFWDVIDALSHSFTDLK